MKSLTVQEVIDKLQKVEDKTCLVLSDGCDCNGEVGIVYSCDGEVALGRADEDGLPMWVNEERAVIL